MSDKEVEECNTLLRECEELNKILIQSKSLPVDEGVKLLRRYV